jgi:hypothetical protein
MLVNFINDKNPRFQLSSYANNTTNNDNQLLRQTHNDIFVYTKQNPAFTSFMPKEKVIPLCENAISNLNGLKTMTEVSSFAKKIRSELANIKAQILEDPKNIGKHMVIDDEYGNKYASHLVPLELPEPFLKKILAKAHDIDGNASDEIYLVAHKKMFTDNIAKIIEYTNS